MENYESMQCSEEDLEKYLDGIPYCAYIKDNDDNLLFSNKLLNSELDGEEGLAGFKLDKLLETEKCKDNSLFTKEYEFSSDNKEFCYETGIIKLTSEEDKPLYGVFLRNITIHKKISDILERHINKLIKSMSLIEYSGKVGWEFSDVIMKNLREELKSGNVFFVVYGLYGGKFMHFVDTGEDDLIRSFNEKIKDIKEINNDNISRLCEEKCFGKQYRAIVHTFNIIPGIVGIMIYKGKCQDLNDIYVISKIRNLLSISSNVMKFISRMNELYGRLGKELEKRKNSEKELQQFIETATDNCCIANIEPNEEINIVKITDSWQKLFGCILKDYKKREYIDHIHEDDKQKYIDEFCKKIENRSEVGKINTLNLRVRNLSGEYRYIQWRWKQVQDGAIAICASDKTQEIRYESEKIRLEKNMSRERMSEQFFTNFSLQFKNPLNTIISAIQLLELYTGKDSCISNYNKAVSYIDVIEKNSYKILKWANDLIEISKIESLYNEFCIEKVNVVEMIENIVDYTNDYFKDTRNNIIFDTDSEEIYTGCDLKKTEKTIFMIIDEIIRYSNNDACIKVQVTHLDKEYVDVEFVSNNYTLKGKQLNDIVEFFCSDADKYMKENVTESCISLRFSLLKEFIKLFNGKISFEKQCDRFKLNLRIPIIDIDDRGEELYTNKTINSLKEKCNIEYSDIS